MLKRGSKGIAVAVHKPIGKPATTVASWGVVLFAFEERVVIDA